MKGEHMKLKVYRQDYNEVDILYTLMSFINISSSNDMHYVISKHILLNLEKVPTMSIGELANLCYTSPATISRFCKDMNCPNFATLKKELAIALQIAQDEIHLPIATKQVIEENPQRLIEKVYKDTKNSLDLGMNDIRIEDIDKICQLIHDAKYVHMIGYQFSKIVCNDFQLKMLKLQKLLYSYVNRGEDIQRLEMIEEGSLIIIVSVRAREELINPLVDQLKAHNATILLMTMNKNYINEKIDHYYYLEGNESDYTQSSIMGMINFMSLFNVIYVRYGLLYAS